MKKLITFIALVAINIIATTSAIAASGDIIGNIYATDIKTYINGYPIPAYNIGGKTCICVEDLEQYGYYVLWLNLADYGYDISFYEDPARLFLANAYNYNPNDVEPIEIPESQYPTGTVIGHIYETDITTHINSVQVPAYNMGGRTCICIEEIASWQGTDDTLWQYVWNPDELRLDLYDTLYNFSNAMNIALYNKENEKLGFLRTYINGCFDIGNVPNTYSHYGVLKDVNDNTINITEYELLKLNFGDLKDAESIELYDKKMTVNKSYPDGASYNFTLIPDTQNIIENDVITFDNYNNYFFKLKSYNNSLELIAQSSDSYVFIPNSDKDVSVVLDENVILWNGTDEFNINTVIGANEVSQYLSSKYNSIFRFIEKDGKIVYIFENDNKNKIYQF